MESFVGKMGSQGPEAGLLQDCEVRAEQDNFQTPETNPTSATKQTPTPQAPPSVNLSNMYLYPYKVQSFHRTTLPYLFMKLIDTFSDYFPSSWFK